MPEKKILIIDDSEIILKLTQATLNKAGYKVFTTTSLVEFDKLIKETPPDLIIIDIKMPEIQGDQICQVLRKDMTTSHIPIVFFSSLKDEELKVLAEKSGADGYISKEHGLDELAEMIEQVVNGILW